MKIIVILLMSFLLVSPAFCDEWSAEITRIDKQGKDIVVSFDISQDEQLVYGSAVHVPIDNACPDCVLQSIEGQLHQIAFDANKIIEPVDLTGKLNLIKKLKGRIVIVDSETLDIEKIPSEKQRLKSERKIAEEEAEQEAKWEANKTKREAKKQDRQSAKTKLKELGLSNGEITALFD